MDRLDVPRGCLGRSTIKELQREAALLAALGTDPEVRTASIDVGVVTKTTSQLVDITATIRAAVDEGDVSVGIALISTPHTTCAVIVNEDEPGFAQDFARALERLAPLDGRYAHNEAPHDEEDEAPNGHAHVRAAFISSPSVMLPIRAGALALGRWQRIFLVELDRGRQRTVQVTLFGRAG